MLGAACFRALRLLQNLPGRGERGVGRHRLDLGHLLGEFDHREAVPQLAGPVQAFPRVVDQHFSNRGDQPLLPREFDGPSVAAVRA